MGQTRALITGLALLLLSACGPILKGAAGKRTVTVLDKPDDPKAVPVEVSYVPEVPEGSGVFVVQATNLPAKVSLVTSMEREAVNVEGKGAVTYGTLEGVKLQTKLLCSKTPCAFVLPLGSQTLHLEAPASPGWLSTTDLYDVDVVPKAQMLTHTMSRRRVVEKGSPGKMMGGIVLETFGWCGVALSPLPLFLSDDPLPGIITLVASAALVGLGYAIYDPVQTEVTYLPSASTVSAFPPQ